MIFPDALFVSTLSIDFMDLFMKFYISVLQAMQESQMLSLSKLARMASQSLTMLGSLLPILPRELSVMLNHR